jgi:hypothetical protein
MNLMNIPFLLSDRVSRVAIISLTVIFAFMGRAGSAELSTSGSVPRVTILLDPRMQAYSNALESVKVEDIAFRTGTGRQLVRARVIIGTMAIAVPNDKGSRFVIQVGVFGPPQVSMTYYEKTARGSRTSIVPLYPGMPGHREVTVAIPYRLYYRDLRGGADVFLLEGTRRGSSDTLDGWISESRWTPNPEATMGELVGWWIRRS